MRRRGAKSFVDDLVLSRGVVLSRADLFCDLLRLSPMTRRFVRFRRTYLLRDDGGPLGPQSTTVVKPLATVAILPNTKKTGAGLPTFIPVPCTLTTVELVAAHCLWLHSFWLSLLKCRTANFTLHISFLPGCRTANFTLMKKFAYILPGCRTANFTLLKKASEASAG